MFNLSTGTLVTLLYDSVISDGNWAEAERALEIAADAGLFDTYAHEAPEHATWTRLCNTTRVQTAMHLGKHLGSGGPHDVYRRGCGQNIFSMAVGSLGTAGAVWMTFGYIRLRRASATCRWSRGMTVRSGLVNGRATRWHSTRGRDAHIY
jgi:hypothetical protein